MNRPVRRSRQPAEPLPPLDLDELRRFRAAVERLPKCPACGSWIVLNGECYACTARAYGNKEGPT